MDEYHQEAQTERSGEQGVDAGAVGDAVRGGGRGRGGCSRRGYGRGHSRRGGYGYGGRRGYVTRTPIAEEEVFALRMQVTDLKEEMRKKDQMHVKQVADYQELEKNLDVQASLFDGMRITVATYREGTVRLCADQLKLKEHAHAQKGSIDRLHSIVARYQERAALTDKALQISKEHADALEGVIDAMRGSEAAYQQECQALKVYADAQENLIDTMRVEEAAYRDQAVRLNADRNLAIQLAVVFETRARQVEAESLVNWTQPDGSSDELE